ncbi:hypothetical protein Slin15195_G017950 [Septoria linicola]|uniref:Rhodopsin domain-containing protein n=1 Tax=Septoria linicola TaxID=215465 RepID=A0A9Q9API8_9PEZI|nr:hypothetical protein Slin14017_G018010 [Septoria linicola]USW48476.1 hypothetical protein Slin15195_G017950 [Septoria linicola]
MSDVSTPTPTPSGGEWITAISDRDRGPLVTITACLMLVAMFFFLGFRMTIRWPWKSLLGFDDLVVVIGSFIASGQSAAVFRAIHCGLGQHDSDLEPENVSGLRGAILASDILSVAALTCSKLAVSLLILRLSTFKRHVYAARIITALICIWGILAVCSTSVPSPGLSLRKAGWIGIGAFSIVLECALFALPVYLVSGLQMRLAAKMTIIVGFAFRIPASILALLRVLAVVDMLSIEKAHMIDVSYDYVKPTIYTTIEMHYSLMAATIPCMHLFLRNFSTGWLGTTANQLEPSISRTKGSQHSSYILSSMKSKHMRSSVSPRGTQQRDSLGDADLLRRPDGGTTTWVMHQDHTTDAESRESVVSSASDKIIVRQTIEIKWDDAPRAAERALLQR